MTSQRKTESPISQSKPRVATKHRSRSRAAWAVVVTVLAVVTAACGSGSKASSPGASNSQGASNISTASLTLVTFPNNYYFTDAVAQQEGFFKEHHLAVKFVKPQAGTSALQLLLSGSIDGLINDGALSVLPAAHGQNIKIIGSVYNRNGWTIYASSKDSKLAGNNAGFPAAILALKGATIGVTSIGAGTDLALQAILIAAGQNPNTYVHRVGVGLTAAALGQLQAGRIDAYVSGDPAGSIFSNVAHPYFVLATQAPKAFADVPQGTLITSGGWLNSHQAEAKEWVAAEAEALQWIENPANLQAAGNLFSSAFGGTSAAGLASVKFMIANVYPYTLPGLKISKSLFNNEVNLLVKTGLVKPGIANYNSTVAAFAQAG